MSVAPPPPPTAQQPAADKPRAGVRPSILFDAAEREASRRSPRLRYLRNVVFRWLCVTVASVSVLILVVLLGSIFYVGVGRVNWQFLSSPPDTNAAISGLLPSLMGTIMLMALCGLFALPLGIATAVFLEEFRTRNNILGRVQGFFQLNIANLAGVPSVVYGIIGLTVFATMLGVFGNINRPSVEFGIDYFDQYFNEAYSVLQVNARGRHDEPTLLRDGMKVRQIIEIFDTADDGTPQIVGQDERMVPLNLIADDADFPYDDDELAARTLRAGDDPGRVGEQRWYYFRLPFGRGLLAGALTLMLVVLPIVIIATQEALRAVPSSLRQGALGLGATPWQVVWRVTLPAALPGMMTGAIIAMSRAIGEAAPLLLIAGIVFITRPPQNLMGDFTALPLQIFNWAGRPQPVWHELAAAGIVVLLVVLLTFNALAIFIRHKTEKPLSS